VNTHDAQGSGVTSHPARPPSARPRSSRAKPTSRQPAANGTVGLREPRAAAGNPGRVEVGAVAASRATGTAKLDGRLFFHDDYSGKTKQIILSVKAGKTGPNHVRDLRGVVEREKAEIGVLISMQEPTKPMRSEAAEAGFYVSPTWADRAFPRIQLLTVAELLDGKRIAYPPSRQVDATFKKAPKAREATATPQQLPL
jgi:hypothetical protein